MLHAERGAAHVDAEDAVELVGVEVEDALGGLAAEDGGVVDENVEAAVVGDGAVDKALDVGLVADVAADEGGVGAQGSGEGLPHGGVDVGDHDAGAVPDEEAHDGLADAAAAAGHDGHLSL